MFIYIVQQCELKINKSDGNWNVDLLSVKGLIRHYYVTRR